MTTSTLETTVKFHTSLNVSDLARAVEFYRVLFDRAPAKRHSDYAKFEVEEPPLVLSLIPGRPGPGGTLNHAGLRLRDSGQLVEIQQRLEAAGIQTKREEGVECCYSKQTKFWVTDPDRTLWELYVLDEEADEDHGHDHDTDPSAGEAGGPDPEGRKHEDGWEHHLIQPVPERIPREDNSLDRVLLKGTANLRPELARLPLILREAFRVLRPGGEIVLHGLGSDQPVDQPLPPLPGPASSVQYVPTEKEQMDVMLAAGFVELRFEKLSLKPYFWVGAAELREVLLAGRKPGFRPKKTAHQAIYLGPLAEVRDDFGNRFPRGERVALNIHDWQALSRGAAADQFLLLPPGEPPPVAACGGEEKAKG